MVENCDVRDTRGDSMYLTTNTWENFVLFFCSLRTQIKFLERPRREWRANKTRLSGKGSFASVGLRRTVQNRTLWKTRRSQMPFG